jgi:hypothetical protein
VNGGTSKEWVENGRTTGIQRCSLTPSGRKARRKEFMDFGPAFFISHVHMDRRGFCAFFAVPRKENIFGEDFIHENEKRSDEPGSVVFEEMNFVS